jgi:S1-C subfamily serine protease
MTTPTTLPPTTTSTSQPTRNTAPQEPTPVVSTIPSPVTEPTDAAHGVESPVGSLAPGSPADASAIAQGISATLVDITAAGSDGSNTSGTGIVVSESGEVLTNDHVVNGANGITADDVGNGQSYVANVVGTDEPDDVAVLQLQGATGLETAPLGDSDAVRLGEGVVAVGNANGAGGIPSYAGGQVTALRRHVVEQDDADGWDVALDNLMETNAQILPGDSGGALVDSGGEVVGIDTAILNGGSGGFAIPIDEALQIARAIEDQAG